MAPSFREAVEVGVFIVHFANQKDCVIIKKTLQAKQLKKHHFVGIPERKKK
jgi:hypothetical protein